MYSLGEKYSLEFIHDKSDKIIINETLLKKLENEDLSSFPEETVFCEKINEKYIYNLILKDKTSIKILKNPVECKFSGCNEPIRLYSYEHLKKILEASNFNCPFYYSKFYRRDIYIDIKKIEQTKFYVERTIEIKDKQDDFKEKIKQIYKNLKKMYEDNNENQYTYEFICPNYNNYFSNIFVKNLSDKFDYICSTNRINLEEKLQIFLEKDNNSNLYPICGPHGTGKTITSLLIHKTLYLQGIKGVYLNFKFFSNNKIDWEEKINTLIKECYFIISTEEELIEFYRIFIKLQNIHDAILAIKNFIEKKEYKIYMIIDQYQNNYNMDNILNQLSNIKIFLISSINDFDVKQNLILKYEEEEFNLQNKNNIKKDSNRIIKYIYIENLVNSKYYEQDKFKHMIKKKIRIYEKNEEKIEEEFKFIYNILEKLSFLPKYFFEYINYYDSIFDLLFNEYSNIIKKLEQFMCLKIIDLYEINRLIDNKTLTDKNSSNIKTIKKGNFIKYLKDVPLKYISFTICESGEYYFYYTFPLFKNILNDFINYNNSINSFINNDNRSEIGICFETILKIRMRAFKELNVDGFFSVNKLTKMDLTENYKYINQKYFHSKNNILIDQKDKQGELYDFAIYKPNKKELVLLQSKYKINKDNVKLGKSYYVESATNIKKLFNSITQENIQKVYLLFISSFKYNYFRRNKSNTTLKNKRINCIFYSVQKHLFSENYQYGIPEIECNDSNMLLPNSEKYTQQDVFSNSDMDEEKEKIEEEDEKEEEEGEEIFLLKKKHHRIPDMDALYSQIMQFIKSNDKIYKKNYNSLGIFKEVGDYNDYKAINFNKNKEYVILFSINNKGNFDLDKQLGLIYFQDNKNFLYNLKKKTKFDNFNDLIDNIENGSFYAIGEKTGKI